MAKATAKGSSSNSKGRATFLVKSEPSVYAFDELLRDGSTVWDGVRNYEARNTLRAMKRGDLLLYYHSNEGKEIVGLARVARTAYQDPKTEEDWSAVDVAPLKRLEKPVTLAQVKAHPLLSTMALVKRSRISVVPVTPAELAVVLALAETKL
jgi:predicted RNA-binding protein with PUA-like domain